MAIITTRPTNGVSFGYLHTVSSTDASDGYVTIDFQVDYMMVASVMITTAAGVVISTSMDADVSYPANGQIRVDNGNSLFTLVAGQQIHIVANRRSS